MSIPTKLHHPQQLIFRNYGIHCDSSNIVSPTMARSLLFVVALALVASTQAFVPSTPIGAKIAVESTTSLDACRVNAKKEKRLRNRDNMRKFQKRGGSRKKIVKKQLASQERQNENEFIAKCFMTMAPPENPAQEERRERKRY